MHPHTKQQLEKAKKSFEANLLDGDSINDCGGAKINCAIDVWEFIEEEIKQALLSQTQMIRAEMVPNEWKNNEGCIGGKECSAVLGFNSFRNEMRFKLDNLINSFK